MSDLIAIMEKETQLAEGTESEGRFVMMARRNHCYDLPNFGAF